MCSPTLLSAACADFGLIAGPSWPLPAGILLSEASSPGSVTSCRRWLAGRGADTPAIRRFLRVGTVAVGTAPAGSRPLALRYGSDLLTLRLLSICSKVMRFFAPPHEEVDGLCQARSLPAVPSPLRAPLLAKLGLLAGLSRRDTRPRSGLRSSNHNPLGNCVGAQIETFCAPDSAQLRFLIAFRRSAPDSC